MEGGEKVECWLGVRFWVTGGVERLLEEVGLFKNWLEDGKWLFDLDQWRCLLSLEHFDHGLENDRSGFWGFGTLHVDSSLVCRAPVSEFVCVVDGGQCGGGNGKPVVYAEKISLGNLSVVLREDETTETVNCAGEVG